MKFLISGDFQVHAWRQFATTLKNGMNSRLANCLKVFRIIREEAKKRGITKLILNGDLLEKSDEIKTEVYNALYQELEKIYDAGIETYINVGNHDIYGESEGRILHALRAFGRLATIVEKPTLVWDTVQIVPWISSPVSFKETLGKLHASRNRCLVLHAGVQGAVTGPTAHLVRNPIKLEDIRTEAYGLVLLSDYHTRQRLAKNAFYLGSPLQHSFGEIHRPCIWEISTYAEGHFRRAKIFTSFPRFRRYRGANRSEFLEAAKSWGGDYVRVSGDLPEEFIQRVANKYNFQVQITASAPEHSRLDTKQFDVEKVLYRYVKARTEKGRKRERLVSLGRKLYAGEQL